MGILRQQHGPKAAFLKAKSPQYVWISHTIIIYEQLNWPKVSIQHWECYNSILIKVKQNFIMPTIPALYFLENVGLLKRNMFIKQPQENENVKIGKNLKREKINVTESNQLKNYLLESKPTSVYNTKLLLF